MGNKELVERIIKKGFLTKKNVIQAFEEVDRINFCIPEQKKNAYIDIALPIYEEQTISQPSTVAIMTELLDAMPGQKVLEVGSGSGYQAAILSKIVGEQGKVYTIECIHRLYEFAKNNLAAFKNVYVYEGDGSKGLKEHAPYDRIIVTAGAPVVPRSLEEQLEVNGRMVIPVGNNEIQKMILITKDENGKISRREKGYFKFVPLLGEEGWKS